VPDPFDDCPVTGVVDVGDDTVDVVVGDEPSVGSFIFVPEPLGVPPRPPIIVDVPPVACVFSLPGTVTMVVEVVTVVGAAADGDVAAGVTLVCGRNGWETTAGAASSDGSALE
jgi:hypothetical protein